MKSVRTISRHSGADDHVALDEYDQGEDREPSQSDDDADELCLIHDCVLSDPEISSDVEIEGELARMRAMSCWMNIGLAPMISQGVHTRRDSLFALLLWKYLCHLNRFRSKSKKTRQNGKSFH